VTIVAFPSRFSTMAVQQLQSAGTMMVHQEQFTVAALQPFNHVLSDDVKSDAEVLKMLQYAYHMANFSHKHLEVQKFMDAKTASTKIVALGGVDLPTSYSALTLQQLGERLDDQFGTAGRNFCKAFCEVQKVMCGHYWSRLEALFDMSETCDSGKLNLQEISDVLPVNEVAKASASLCAGQEEILVASKLLFGNVNRLQHKGGTAQYLAKGLEDVSTEIETLENKAHETKLKVGELRGELEGNIAMEKAFAACEGRKQDLLDALKVELKAVEGKLKTAEQQEHDYNYRCYGPFKWVWENDVKLAKEKVIRYKEQVDRLKEQIKVASEAAGDMDLATQRTQVLKTRVHTQEQITAQEQVLDRIRGKITAGEKQQARIQTKLELLLKEEGKESCEQLLDAMAAIRSVGETSVSARNTGEVMVTGWVKDLEFLAMSLSWLARKCKTIDSQRSCLRRLQQWADEPTNKLARFMKQVPPITDLTTTFSFESSRPQSAKPKAIVATTGEGDLSEADIQQFLNDLRKTDVPAEVNLAVVEQRVQAIENGSEPSATDLPPADEATEEPVKTTSDEINFVDEMAGDFD